MGGRFGGGRRFRSGGVGCGGFRRRGVGHRGRFNGRLVIGRGLRVSVLLGVAHRRLRQRVATGGPELLPIDAVVGDIGIIADLARSQKLRAPGLGLVRGGEGADRQRIPAAGNAEAGDIADALLIAGRKFLGRAKGRVGLDLNPVGRLRQGGERGQEKGQARGEKNFHNTVGHGQSTNS